MAMDKTPRSDNELVLLSQQGDHEATNELLERYKPMVRRKSNTLFLMGADVEDLIQEGMIGLFLALREYDPSREASFKTFANICVSGQMHHAIAAALRDKHKPLNGAISLDVEQHEGEGDTLENLLIDLEENEPESLYIEQENMTDLISRIRHTLSDLEWKVFCMYIRGDGYKEIAVKLNRSEKSIDNALNRIKKKAGTLLEEESN
jgi:RNA polymerase sporulation-specific sigma factor